MGLGLATNLLKKGHRLTVLNHAGNQPLDSLVPLGVKVADSITDTVKGADAVILCVTGSPAVEAIVLGPGGVVDHLKKDMLIIDCSTSQPASTKKVAAAVLDKGGKWVDAAMTRTPKEAMEGRLNLLLGGSLDHVAEATPILRCFAENIYHAGPDPGSGHALKLLHNYVSLGSIALISEAAACADTMGISGSVFHKVLNEGGGSGIALNRLQSYLLDRDPSGLKFSLGNAKKDIEYYNAMADEAGVRRDIARGVKTTLEGAVDRGGGDVFTPELIRLLRD